MGIKFIAGKKNMSFEDVHIDHFFKDNKGNLCQKIDHCSYNTLATKHGALEADSINFADDNPPIVVQIYNIERIEF